MNQQLSFRTLCYTFLWPLWARNKRLYSLTALGLLIVGIVIHLPIHLALSLQPALVMGYAFAAGALLLTVVGFNAYGINTQSPSAQDSTYLKGIFTLPISTPVLIFSPILIGSVGFALLWLPFVAAAIVPLRIAVPWELPLLLAIAVVAMMHTLWWLGARPTRIGGCGALLFILMTASALLRLSFSKMMVQVAVSAELTMPAKYRHFIHPRPISWLREDVIVAIIAIAWIAVATVAAPLARHQAPLSQRGQGRERMSTPKVATLPISLAFLSSLDAQTWFERARYVYLVPVFVVFITLITSIFPLFMAALFGGTVSAASSIYQGGIEAYMPIPVVLGGGLIAALLLGTNSTMAAVVKMSNGAKLQGIDGFLAARPVTCAQIVFARLQTARTSALITGGFLAYCVAVWPVSAAGIHGENGLAIANMLSHPTVPNLLLGGLVAVCLPLAVWCVQCGNPFMDLMGSIGRRFMFVPVWLLSTYFFIEVMTGSLRKVEFSKSGVWESNKLMNPEILPRLLLQIVVLGLLLLGFKLVLFIRTVMRIRKRKLVPDQTLLKSAGLWVFSSLFLVGSFYALLPSGFLSILQLTLIVTLLLPANRILLQILSLDASRHQ